VGSTRWRVSFGLGAARASRWSFKRERPTFARGWRVGVWRLGYLKAQAWMPAGAPRSGCVYSSRTTQPRQSNAYRGNSEPSPLCRTATLKPWRGTRTGLGQLDIPWGLPVAPTESSCWGLICSLALTNRSDPIAGPSSRLRGVELARRFRAVRRQMLCYIGRTSVCGTRFPPPRGANHRRIRPHTLHSDPITHKRRSS
jgi:hypothetical protein